MSKYTTEVRFICETAAGYDEPQGFSKVDSIIEAAWNKIFTSKFPIFDESYRKELCCKILKHFYTREIGAETVGLWKLWLNERMELIMPYYNKMYEGVNKKFDIFGDVDLTTIHTLNRDQNGSYSSKTSNSVGGTAIEKYSDTPQGSIHNLVNDNYLTNATYNTTNSNENGTGSGNTTDKMTDNYNERITGKRGGASYSAMLTEYLEALKNVDLMLMDELNDLFMLLW